MEVELSSPVICSSVSDILCETYKLRRRRACVCRVRRMYWAAGCCLLHAVAMGFCVGYSAPATYHMRRSPLNPSEEEVSWIGSVLALGGMCGGLIGGPMADKVGRRAALLLNVLVLWSGWFLIVEASVVPPVVIGRFVCGLGCGVVSVAAPAYCVEISTPEVRGLLGSLFQTAVVSGSLLCFALGALLSWQTLGLAAAAAAGLALLLFAAAPESPRWWLAQGDRFRAHRAVRRLHGPRRDVDRECDRIHEALQSQPRGGLKAREWANPMVFKPALLTLGLMFFQQFSGANAILYYSTQIFDAHKDFMDPKAASIVLGAMQVLATLASNLLVDRVGRKGLLLISGAVMGVAELALALFYYKASIHSQLASDYPWIPLLCICSFIVAFSLGFGPLPWLLMAEMVPLRARSRVGGLATFANGLFAFVITKTFALMLYILHDYGAFLAYGVVSSVSCIFVLAFIPETKGKEIEDIAVFFCKDAKKRTESLREILTEEINAVTSFPRIEDETRTNRSLAATIRVKDKTMYVSNLSFEQLQPGPSGIFRR